MQSQFEQVLEEFGEILDLRIEIPDSGPLTISVSNQYNIQIRVDVSGHYIELISKIAEIPPGAFSTKVFREALIHNSSKPFRYGIIGYSTKTKSIVMHGCIPLLQADGEELAAFFEGFVASLSSWKEALERGDPGPPRQSSQISGEGPSPFGLKM